MTEYDKANISWILNGNGDWFTADLFRLISRSDTANKEKLALSFPDEVNAVHEFQTGKPLAKRYIPEAPGVGHETIGEVLKKSYIGGAIEALTEE